MSLKQRLGNWLFVLLIFMFVADPTNTIFGLKSIVFVVLFAYNIICFRADVSKFKYFLLPLIAISLSFVFAAIRGEVYDVPFIVGECTAFVPLLLLPWISNYNVLGLSRGPVIFMVSLVVVLFWVISFVPSFEHTLYAFTSSNDHTIMLSRRVFMGYSAFAMYCKATVAFIPIFAIVVYEALCVKKRVPLSLLVLAIFVHYFLISGTRSSMLLPLLLMFMIIFIFKRNNRYLRYVIYSLVILACVLLVALFVVLISEDGEQSNMVKYAHLSSYIDHFGKNPFYLITGQGPGTSFYTKGFYAMVMNTEWSYLELIRRYGLFSLMIFYLFFEPLKRLYALKDTDKGIVVLLAYVIYLIIAGTNPLLLSSTGMLIVLMVHGFIENGRKNVELDEVAGV